MSRDRVASCWLNLPPESRFQIPKSPDNPFEGRLTRLRYSRLRLQVRRHQCPCRRLHRCRRIYLVLRVCRHQLYMDQMIRLLLSFRSSTSTTMMATLFESQRILPNRHNQLRLRLLISIS